MIQENGPSVSEAINVWRYDSRTAITPDSHSSQLIRANQQDTPKGGGTSSRHNATLVAVVGADGAGKSTISRLLVERLVEMGYPARHVDRWDIVGNHEYPAAVFLENNVPLIRQCLADMPTPARFLFLLWSMSFSLAPVLDQSSSKRDIVVLDSYWMKHAASEIAYGLDPEWALAAISVLPVPQVVIHLKLDIADAWIRKRGNLVPYECGLDAACSRERFLEHQGRIAGLLDQWSKRLGWKEVDSLAPLSATVDEALDHTLRAAGR